MSSIMQMIMSMDRGIIVTPTINLLVVAGGGSGGASGGTPTFVPAHGGAGGLLEQIGRTVAAGTAYTVTVGTGGIVSGAATIGTNGSNSVFDTVTAIGGGRGAGATPGGSTLYAANNGGSGGGGLSATLTTAGTATQTDSGGATSYKNSGATGSSGNPAGGGGAGSVGGVNAVGAGRSNSITGSAVTYAIGGGSTALANLGSGGSPANAGDTGVVILAYPNTFALATSTTGSPTYSNVGGNHIYKFTASGTITF